MIGQSSPTSAVAKFADGLKTIAARVAALERVPPDPGWVAFTPSWTSLAIGNGTQVAEYHYQNGILEVYGYVTFGSSTAVSGAISQTLPDSATMRSSTAAYAPVGDCTMRDTGTGSIGGQVNRATSTTVSVQAWNAASTYLATAATSATAPFTWASGDSLLYRYRVPV
jgi:hypothetical protein